MSLTGGVQVTYSLSNDPCVVSQWVLIIFQRYYGKYLGNKKKQNNPHEFLEHKPSLPGLIKLRVEQL